MKITVEVTGTREQRLAEIARRLNVRPEDVAAAAVEDILGKPDPDFGEATQRVLEKNRELYRRLS